MYYFSKESASYFKEDTAKCKIIFENVYKAAFILMTTEKKGTSSKDIQGITDIVKLDTKEHVNREDFFYGLWNCQMI